MLFDGLLDVFFFFCASCYSILIWASRPCFAFSVGRLKWWYNCNTSNMDLKLSKNSNAYWKSPRNIEVKDVQEMTDFLFRGWRGKQKCQISSPPSLYVNLKLININVLETSLLLEKRVSWINISWKLCFLPACFAGMPFVSLLPPNHQYVFSEPEGQNPLEPKTKDRL